MFLINPNPALIQSLQSLHVAKSRAAGGADKLFGTKGF